MIHMLCIEDNSDIQTILRLALEASGKFKVTQGMTGEQGISIAFEAQPDAILLDFGLPDMDDPAVLERLKGDLRTTGIPVIMLTARTEKDDEKLCRECGALSVIEKPFDPRTFAKEIAALLEKPIG